MNSGPPNPQHAEPDGQRSAPRSKWSKTVVTILSLLGVAGVVILAVRLLQRTNNAVTPAPVPPPTLPGEGPESQATVSRATAPEMTVPPSPTPEPSLTPQAYCKQGYALLHKERRIAEAISTFETCLRFCPDYSDAHHGLAQALRNSGDLSRALASHDRAIEFDPDRYDLYWERGVTWLELNNYDGAITNFEACLERKIDFANAHLGLGMAWRGKGDYVEALLHHDEALRLNPRSAWFYNERARTHEKKGDRRSAEADFAKAREIEQGK